MRILSIDGGGIKGLIPAQILTYLEHDYGHRISDLFDLLVGTSTGGILVLGLVHPRGFSAKDLVELYLQNAATIFNSKGTGTSFFSPKYDASGLRQVLSANFGQGTALHLAKREVAVTSYDLVSCQPVILSSYGLGQEGTFFDSAAATSAGETYFPAHGSLIDGGNIANNPSLIGLAESVKFSTATETRILSLGTGRYDPSLENLENGGELQWATHISDVTIDGVAERDARIAKALLGPRYLRIQPNLTKAQSPMDNIGTDNMAQLQALAAQAYSDNKAAIEEFMK